MGTSTQKDPRSRRAIDLDAAREARGDTGAGPTLAEAWDAIDAVNAGTATPEQRALAEKMRPALREVGARLAAAVDRIPAERFDDPELVTAVRQVRDVHGRDGVMLVHRVYDRHGRRGAMAQARAMLAPVGVTPQSRTAARARGAGRPRAAASRSSARSGDSGGGASDPEPPAEPASAGRSPSLAPSRLTLREVRARIVADLVAQHGLRATVAILDRAGWPLATRALAYRDAGVEEAAP